MAKLKTIELRGNAASRGLQHGRLLRDSIQTAVDFYRDFFARYLNLDGTEMRRRAARFIEPTARLDAQLMSEYEGIAEGSGQTLEDIFALSARYEITFEDVALGDCSNLFVNASGSEDGHVLLGQSWDWRPEVMDFRAVFTARCDDEPDHIMVTECGQPGKYGFSTEGIGVVSAGLRCEEKVATGEQLFVVLCRQVLKQTGWQAAIEAIEASPPMATVNMIVADESGSAANLEFTPGGIFKLDLAALESYWHTNHCLIADEPIELANSQVRAARWTELMSTDEPISAALLQRWLADRGSGEHSICQLPNPSAAETATYLQTLSSIVMDLNASTLWVSDGPSCDHPYESFQL